MVVGHLHSSALSFAPEKFSMCNKTSVARIRFRKMELFSWQAHFGEGTKSTFRVWWGIVRQRLVNILLKRNSANGPKTGEGGSCGNGRDKARRFSPCASLLAGLRWRGQGRGWAGSCRRPRCQVEWGARCAKVGCIERYP